MKNLLKEIDPVKLIGKTISYEPDYDELNSYDDDKYYDKIQAAGRKLTIIDARIGKKLREDVLNVALLDVDDAQKNQEHREEYELLMQQQNKFDALSNDGENFWHLRYVLLQIKNPLMRKSKDDYEADHRSYITDEVTMEYNEEEIETIDQYFGDFNYLQREMIKLFSQEEFVGEVLPYELLSYAKVVVRNNNKKELAELHAKEVEYERNIADANNCDSIYWLDEENHTEEDDEDEHEDDDCEFSVEDEEDLEDLKFIK